MMTNLNRDFVDLLCAFSDAQVDYLLVGAHALAVHGHVRATKDLTNKRASGRAQDLADLERLESIHRDPER